MHLSRLNPVLDPTTIGAGLYAELWVSLASLLRSYSAAHGLHNNIHAKIEQRENQIIARFGNRYLQLDRVGANVMWKREDGAGGTLQLTADGRLQSAGREEELDMAAEAWARDLMRELQP
jgi:hypothetical protein